MDEEIKLQLLQILRQLKTAIVDEETQDSLELLDEAIDLVEEL